MMEAAVRGCFYVLLSVVICNGFHVLGPSGPLTVQLGHSVMLPCFVETPLPVEKLEVEWKRHDSEILVHLWQNGESRPEAQNHRYHERAHFFTEEVTKGNFSILLTNVTRKDAGVYKCVVYTERESNYTQTEITLVIEHLIVSGAQFIFANAGEDITLNCSVDSHIPAGNIEEVSWKKMEDEDILVLLYQEGEVQTVASHERYKDRVEFFSTDEINKGNFSLRLKDVQTEDKGLYICLVFSGDLSDNTTVEVQQLGLSFIHIGMIILCLLGFLFGSLILGYLSYTSFDKNDDSRRALVIQCAHVLCPNIIMGIVFILWGVTEGFFSEAATCSALNFVRILFLLWIVSQLKSFKDYLSKSIIHWAILLQYIVITAVVYLYLIVDAWRDVNSVMRVMIPVGLILGPFMTLQNVTDFALYFIVDLWRWHQLTTLGKVLLIPQFLRPLLTILCIIPLFNILGVLRDVSAVQKVVIPVVLLMVSFLALQGYGFGVMSKNWRDLNIKRKLNRVLHLLGLSLTFLCVIPLVIILNVWSDVNTLEKMIIPAAVIMGLVLVLQYVSLLVSTVIRWSHLKTEVKVIRLISLICLPLRPLVLLLHNTYLVCHREVPHKTTAVFNYLLEEVSNFLRIFILIFLYGSNLKTIIVAVFPFLAVICFSFRFIGKQFVLVWISVMITLEVLSTSGSIYIHYDLVKNVKERGALTCVTVFLQILTLISLMTRFTNLQRLSDTESDSRNTVTKQYLSCLVIFGTAVVVFVNAVALLVELILKTRNGQRTVDLRFILLPTESVFVVCCLVLQISASWKKNRERLRNDVKRLCECVCGCKQTPQDSPPEPEEHEPEEHEPEEHEPEEHEPEEHEPEDHELEEHELEEHESEEHEPEEHESEEHELENLAPEAQPLKS